MDCDRVSYESAMEAVRGLIRSHGWKHELTAERATVLAPVEAAAQAELPRLIVVSGMLLGFQIELDASVRIF